MSKILDKNRVITSDPDAEPQQDRPDNPNDLNMLPAYPVEQRGNGHTPDVRHPDGAGPQSDRDPRTKVIKFSHVSKRFTLHQERPHSFQEMLTSRLGRGRKLAVPPPELAP